MLTLFFFLAVCSTMLSIFFGVIHYKKRRSLRMKFKLKGMPVKNLFYILEDYFIKTAKGQKMILQLNFAEIGMRPIQFIFLQIIFSVIGGFFLSIFLKISFLVNLVLAFNLVQLMSAKFIKMRIKKILRQVNSQLPEVCRLIANSVKAGLSLQQGVEMVSAEVKDPAGSIFRRLSNEIKLGISMVDAINDVNNKVLSKELKLFNNALLIQHKSGGNLALILEEMAKTLEMRKRVNQEILSGTAEARFIAMLLPFMPLAAAVMLNFMIPGFLEPLFTLPGLIMSVIFVLMVSVGFIFIKQISDIRV